MDQYSQDYSSGSNPSHNNNSSRRGYTSRGSRNRPTRNGPVRRSIYRRPRCRNNHVIRGISLQFNGNIFLNTALSMMSAEPLSLPPVPFIGNDIPQPPGSGFVPFSTGGVQTHAAEQTLQAPTYDTQGQQPFPAFQGATAANNASPVLRETHEVGPAATTPLVAPPTTTPLVAPPTTTPLVAPPTSPAIWASTADPFEDLLTLFQDLEGGRF